ncbi:cadherin domain-containing protein [Geofilum sp. OHC36d9]|uniref:cadherin domain-containing protein n=1 Tax=Geofilum sp. OHC36d9 TaxID=3458413 RepID=UPI004034C1D5
MKKKFTILKKVSEKPPFGGISECAVNEENEEVISHLKKSLFPGILFVLFFLPAALVTAQSTVTVTGAATTGVGANGTYSYVGTTNVDGNDRRYFDHNDAGSTYRIEYRYNDAESVYEWDIWESTGRGGSGTVRYYNSSPDITIPDGAWETDMASGVVTVSYNMNNVPTDISLSSFAIDENVSANSSVGTFSTTDADAGDSHTYSLVSGSGDTDNGSFYISGSDLHIIPSPDYETKNSYSFRIQTSDGTDSYSEAFTVYINNLDETPVITALQSFSVDEDAANASSVGTVLATDADAGTSFSAWTITAGNEAAVFAFNASTGEITVDDNTNLDYETTTSYTLTLTVSDGVNTSAAETVSINVTDINEATPVITALQSFSVDEDAANGGSVGTVLATDADAGTSFSAWTITAGNEAAVFAINASTGEITVADNTNLDYETTTSYTLTLTVSDGVNTSAAETVSINITDINEATPVITASQSFSVDEDAANGSSVGTVLATDADAGTSFSAWTITAGNEAAVFAINASTGEIVVDDNTNLDYETTTSYVLTLTVSDGVNTSAAETVSINVTDINEATPVITASQSFSVDEDAANASSVGTVLATDADAGTSFSDWIITAGNEAAVFAINASTGEIVVDDNTNLDYETTTSYVLTLTVSDGVNISAAETVSINVTDINEATPVITASQSFSVDEDAANASSVGTVLATDADAGTSFSAWTITAGNEAAVFAINASTGEITVADNTNLDYETTTSYTLTLTVSDGVNTSAAETVSVNVTDINDTPPVIAGNQQFNILETAVQGAEVGSVLATDADGSTMVFSIISGNIAEAFTIDNDGLLMVNSTLNYDVLSQYVLAISVSDGVNSSNEEVVVNVMEDTGTGVLISESSDSNFTVYPNPASDLLYTSLDGELLKEGTLDIFSVDGIRVWHRANYLVGQPVAVGYLRAGVYCVIFTLQGQLHVQKVVIK